MPARSRITGPSQCLAAVLLLLPAVATAQVFEVIHPDVERGGFELEILGGVSLVGVATGGERAAFEIGLSYGVTDFWKTGLAVEIADPKGGRLEYEATEWENMFLLYRGQGHAHGHDHDHDHDVGAGIGAIGLYAKLEVPNDGGFSKGAIVAGPAIEARFGAVETVFNLFVEFPFEGGEDPGLVYAVQASIPVADGLALGAEAHGAWEGAFGDDVPFSDNTHVAGPALYGEIAAGRGRVIEPRLALLFGLTDESPDAVASLNIEVKF